MGKTFDGAVWLDETMLSPFDYFQYFRNTHDADVGKFLKLFTDLDLSEIENLEKLKDQEINKAKEILAFEAVKICHGENAANEALQKAREIFVSKNSSAFEEKEVSLGVEGAKKLIEIMKEIGSVESNGEAKKLIEGKGVKIDGETVLDAQHLVKEIGEFNLSVGKKKFFKIIVN
jgi:tyrosyl-tRNA synthetase